jgi:ferric-dicitrate binding protein FerR (iron transport regulator)
MPKLSYNKNRRKVINEENIEFFIVQYLDQSIEADNEKLLLQWMEADSSHLAYFVAVRKIWDSSIELNSSPEETANALAQFRKKAGGPSTFHRSAAARLRSALPYRAIRVAAVLVAGIAAYTLSFLLEDHSVKNHSIAAQVSNKIIIPKGQKGQLILSDGTRVWLNSESILEYPGVFDPSQREVSLSGEAYFEVASDKHHPFIVKTGKLDIIVTGTIFNVKAYRNERMETTLLEGSVSLRKGEMEILKLRPSESATYLDDENRMVVKNFNDPKTAVARSITKEQSVMQIKPVEILTVWKEDQLIFMDEPLGNMIQKMERWFNRSIHVSEQLLPNRYNGKFVYHETIHQVLDVICKSSGLKYKEIDHEFYIYENE